MSQDNGLHEDLEKHLKNFNKIKQRSLDEIQNKSALKLMYMNLKGDLQTLKENEDKTVKLLESTRKICKEQMEMISKLNKFKVQNETLVIQIASKNTEISKLQEQIKKMKWENEIKLQNQAVLHVEELEKHKNDFDLKAIDLKDELDLVFNSSEIHSKELENQIKLLKAKSEEELKRANAINIRMQTNISVYEKKICELEEKVKFLEEDRKMLLSAKENCNNTTNNTQKSSNKRFNNSNIEFGAMKSTNNDQRRDPMDCTNAVQYFEQMNKNTDYDGKFNFRQNLIGSNEKKNISNRNEYENFNTNKQMEVDDGNKLEKSKLNNMSVKSTGFPENESESDYERNDFQNGGYPQNSYAQKCENKANCKSINRQVKPLGLNKNNTCGYKPSNNNNMMPLNVTNSAKNDAKPQFPTNKKRKLYNPNNYDYIE